LQRGIVLSLLIGLIVFTGAVIVVMLNQQPTADIAVEQNTSVPAPGTPRASPAVFTPNPTIADFISPTPADQEYDLIVSNAYFVTPDDEGNVLPQEGERWYVVNANIFNMAGYEVTITPETLFLRIATGESYTAAQANEEINPSLLGITLEAGEAQSGLFHFVIPEEAMPAQLFWCPREDNCNDPIYTEIPIPNTNSSEG